jgi:hypothetical protein
MLHAVRVPHPRPPALPMNGTLLTDTGLEAMARTILRIASDGERDWDRETPELRQELLGYVDEMVVAASEAEERVSR